MSAVFSLALGNDFLLLSIFRGVGWVRINRFSQFRRCIFIIYLDAGKWKWGRDIGIRNLLHCLAKRATFVYHLMTDIIVIYCLFQSRDILGGGVVAFI